MAKSLFLMIVLCYSFCAGAQQGYVYDFEKLIPLDHIPVSQGIGKLREEATEFEYELLYTPVYGDLPVSALIYRKGSQWEVYEAPFTSDFVEFLTYSDDGKYALFEVVGRSRSTRSGEAEMRHTYIINLEEGSYAAVLTGEYILEVTYENEDDEFGYPSYFEADTQVILNGNTVTLLESVFDHDRDGTGDSAEFGAYDSQSGVYELRVEQLVKTHYYDARDKRMKPLVYAAGLAIGMDLRAAEEVLSPYDEVVELKSVPQWLYGYDSEEYGYEVLVDGEPHYFVVIEESDDGVRRIAHMIVISPKITVRGLHTGMTVGEVLEKYPDAQVNIDSLNDGEYIYIKELELRLMFTTDDGKQVTQPQDAKAEYLRPVRILDKDRKVDYIIVVR